MLDPKKILARANELYADKKTKKHGDSHRDRVIESDQVKAVVEAIIEAFNSRVQY